MFRVVAYYNNNRYPPDQSIRFESLSMGDYNEASEILDTLVYTRLFQGGHIEEYIDGIGWTVIVDSDD